MRENEFTKILGWPGYRVYRHEIDEGSKTLRLWVRRKRGNRQLICSGCGRSVAQAHDSYEREVRDLPWRKYQTTVIVRYADQDRAVGPLVDVLTPASGDFYNPSKNL